MQQKERVTGIKPVARSFQCFENLCSRILADMFLVLFGKFRWTEWFAVFQNYMVFSNLRKLFFKDRYGVVHSNRDNQTVSFSCQTKASFMEFQKFQIAFIPVSGAFREDADRDTGLDQLDTRQDGFSPFLYLSGQGRDSGDNASSLKAEVSSPSQLWQYSRSAAGSGCR